MRCFYSIALLCAVYGVVCLADDSGWNVVRSRHFLVYHTGESGYADKVIRRAESYYHRIARDLGFKRYGGYWLWDNRAKIYIYKNQKQFMKTTGAPEWASGRADYSERAIATFEQGAGFMDSTLPHELTHLIFREWIGFEGEIPLWLDEGVAQWEEKGSQGPVQKFAKRLLDAGRMISIQDLTRMKVKDVVESGRVSDFYAQAMSLVGFMIEEHGSEKFREFCGRLKDGGKLDDALRFTYPAQIRNIEQLEQRWLQYLKEIK